MRFSFTPCLEWLQCAAIDLVETTLNVAVMINLSCFWFTIHYCWPSNQGRNSRMCSLTLEELQIRFSITKEKCNLGVLILGQTLAPDTPTAQNLPNYSTYRKTYFELKPKCHPYGQLNVGWSHLSWAESQLDQDLKLDWNSRTNPSFSVFSTGIR